MYDADVTKARATNAPGTCHRQLVAQYLAPRGMKGSEEFSARYRCRVSLSRGETRERCSVLQCVLQCVAVCCSVLQCVAVRCSVLQCATSTATHCNALQWCERCLLITESPKTLGHYRYLIWVLEHLIYCSTLQHNTTHGNSALL